MNKRGTERTCRRAMLWAMSTAVVIALSACSSGPAISIQSLVEQAALGETVIIPPGTYRENVSISKSITLVGEATDSRGVEIVGNEAHEAAIEITGGAEVQVTLRDIAITRSYSTGITLSGAVTVTLENVQAENCWSSGLSIRDDSHITAIDCAFSESDRNGITITSNGHLDATDCLLEDSAASGLAAVTTGTVTLSSCVIQNNGETGLDIGGETRLELDSVTIADNGSGEPTRAKFVTLGTAITNQSGCGIWMKDDASILLEDCVVSGSMTHGIMAFDNSSVELVASEVSGNGGAGVVLVSDGTHRLQDDVIDSNRGEGVFLARSADVELTGCTISSNEYGGVAIFSTQCYGADASSSSGRYTGHLTGRGNVIPEPDEPAANGTFSCCPESRCMSLELPIEEAGPEGSGT